MPINAAPPDWGTDRRLTFSNGDSTNPRVLMDSTETIFVVWQDDRDGDNNIFLKKSSDYGVTWSSDTKVTFTHLQSGWPRIAIDSNDVLHLLYLEEDETNPTYSFYPYDSDPKQILYQNSADGGVTWSSPLPMVAFSGQMQYCGLDICVGQADMVHVSYSKYSPSKVYHRRTTDGGTTWSSPIEIGSDIDAARPNVIAADNLGHVYVAFHTWGNLGDIDFIKSSDNGVTWGSAITLLGGYGWPSRAHLTALDDGHVFLTYVSNKYGTDHWIDNREVYIIISSDYASTWGSEIRVTHSGFRMENPFTVIGPDNNINIVWQDVREGNWEIFYTKLDINGNTLVDDTRITNDSAISGHPKIVIDSSNTRYVFWHDNRVADDNYEIFTKGDTPEFEPPIADAGPNQTVNEGDVVQFNGSGSHGYGGYGGGGWDIQIVDSEGNVGMCTSLDLDPYDNPHIAYCNWTSKNLKFAQWTGSTWKVETVDDSYYVGHYNSMELDSNGFAHIGYTDFPESVKYAQWNGAYWNIENASEICGGYISLALDSNDYPHMSYFSSVYNIKYLRWTGSIWEIETIANYGIAPSIVLDSNDYPHIAYFSREKPYREILKYLRWTGSDWINETVDETDNFVGYISLALDSNDFPHIVYRDIYNGTLKYARWTGFEWLKDILDIAGFGGFPHVPRPFSLVLDDFDNPHISYKKSNDVIYSRWTGANWTREIVDSADGLGYYVSLKLDNDGYPNIAYYDYTNGNLKFAKRSPGEPSKLTYSWDFNNYNDSNGDGDFTNDVDATGPTPTHIYGDNGVFVATLTINDDQGLTATDTCNITVLNVDPTVEIESVAMEIEVGLRVAGRKFNDVGMTLYEDDIPIGYISIERLPGSPDDQMAWIPLSIDFSKSYTATVIYTPEDPPNIGANPVWIYLKSENGSIKEIHHTFNVQQSMKRDSEHWNHVEPWEVDLNAHFIGIPFEITTHITDPGSDDIFLSYSYGSQNVTVTYPNNPPNPDPYPSPEVNPRDIIDSTHLLFKGPGTVLLTLTDDDGGTYTSTIAIG
jgi:hypothetical protein